MRQLVAGLAWTTRWRGTWRVPSSPAISKARTRLGPAVLAALFDRVCVPVAAPDTPGAFYRSWRLVAVDGTTFDAPDEAVNTARFGKPSNDQGTGAFPQVRVVALAECGTHAVFAAALAGITTGEQELFRAAAGQDRCGDAGAGRPQLPGPPTVGRRRRDRGGPAVAGQVRHPTARGHRTGRGLLPVLPGRARHPRTRPADHRARHRVHAGVLDLGVSAQGRRGLPPGHHHPRPRPRPRRGSRRRLRAALGDRVGPRRDQDPPARSPDRCCAPATRTGSSRRSGGSCWSTTRSATSSTSAPATRASTPTGCRSPARCAPPAARSPTRRGFPPSRLRRATRQAVAELLQRLNKRRRRHNPRVVRRTHRTPFPAKKPIDRHLVQPPPDLINIVGRA